MYILHLQYPSFLFLSSQSSQSFLSNRWREDDDLFDEDLPVEPLEAFREELVQLKGLTLVISHRVYYI